MAGHQGREAWDEKPAPRVPEPLFPMLRKLGAADVQRARAWLLAWLLDRLGQRVQPPPPPAYHIQRRVDHEWLTVMGPFHRGWIATQLALEMARMNRRWRYRVVGPDTEVEVAPTGPLPGGVPDGD
jgi:hypothetical protein